jgi:hypothetical protein
MEPIAFRSRRPARRAKLIPEPPGAGSIRERSERRFFRRHGSKRVGAMRKRLDATMRELYELEPAAWME